MGVSAIILAAGRSARLGQPKQLVEINGEPLLRRTVRTVLTSQCARVVVVTGFQNAEIASVVDDLPVEIVHNSQWSEGIASSIRAGIEAARSDEAAIITPCDLPLLTATHLDEIIGHFKNGRDLIASRWDEVCGPPALFAPRFYAELQNLKGDAGARVLLQKHAVFLQSVAFPQGHFDLDTPDDVLKFSVGNP